MRTRGKSAEEKRKAEEKIKRVERGKRQNKRFKRRKLIGPHDLTVDRNLPKIYIDPADVGEAKVKVEIKEEPLQIIGHLEEDGVFESFQQDEVVVAEEENEVDEQTMKMVLLMVLPLLEQRDVFKCRLVNKQWRRIVDDFFEESVVPKPYDDKAYLEKLRRSPLQMCPLSQFELDKITYKFEEEAEVQNYNEVMKNHMESGHGFVLEIFNGIMIKSYYQTQLKQLSLNWAEELAYLEVDNVNELSFDYFQFFELNERKLQAVEKLTFSSFKLNLKDDMAQKFPNLGYLRLTHCFLPSCLIGLNANWHKINIHTLELIEFDVEQCSFSNLTPFPHLRHLIIRNQRVCWLDDQIGSVGGEMELKQLFFGGTTYRTNLWQILPKLEVFTLQFRDPIGWPRPWKNNVETRDGYQKYIQKKQIM